MNYILDTHTLIWTLFDSTKLSDKAKNIILNPGNNIFLIFRPKFGHQV